MLAKPCIGNTPPGRVLIIAKRQTIMRRTIPTGDIRMFFVILATDRPGALDQRLAHRQKHLDYWNGMPGVVRIGGPMLSDDSTGATPKGSTFIVEAENLQAARKLIAEDPFMKEGIFGDDVRIEVLRPTIGDWKPA
jgi:uncharacterized protein YciI